MVLNPAKFQVKTFSVSNLLRENQQGVEVRLVKLPPPRLGLIIFLGES